MSQKQKKDNVLRYLQKDPKRLTPIYADVLIDHA